MGSQDESCCCGTRTDTKTGGRSGCLEGGNQTICNQIAFLHLNACQALNIGPMTSRAFLGLRSRVDPGASAPTLQEFEIIRRLITPRYVRPRSGCKNH